jgi:branched-chain amino acid transport system ATP-binding protein
LEAAVFGLEDKKDVLAKNLPQGDKKTDGVAFALHPEVILLDEPTSGGTSDKNRIMETLVSHQRSGSKRSFRWSMTWTSSSFSDRIIALHQGKILADNTPEEIEKDEEVVCTVVGQKECFKIFSTLLKRET